MRTRTSLLILIILLMAACGAPAGATQEGVGELVTAEGATESSIATEVPVETEEPATETQEPTALPGPTDTPIRARLRYFGEHPCELIERSDVVSLPGVAFDGEITETTETDAQSGEIIGTCTYEDLFSMTLHIVGPGENAAAEFARAIPADSTINSPAYQIEGAQSVFDNDSGLSYFQQYEYWFVVTRLADKSDFTSVGLAVVTSDTANRLLSEVPRPDSPPEDPVTFADPCNLLTVAEVEAQIGALTEDPLLLSDDTPQRGEAQECQFGAEGNQVWISVARYYEHNGAEADFILRRPSDAEPVTGLGFDAFFVDDGGSSLQVLATLDILSISLQNNDSGDGRRITQALAQAAYSRLENGASPSDSGAPAPDFPPCDALTEDQAAGVLGTLTSPPQPGSAVGESVGEFLTCIYSGERDTAFLSFRHFSSAQNARAYYDNALASAGDAEELFGYGDAGFVRDGGRSLTAIRGTLVISVQSGLRESSEGVASIALVRIP